jgi:hypothetical protein
MFSISILESFLNYWALLIDKYISLENYLTQIIDLYKFEKKKKNPVTDTSESDEISGTSGDSSSSSDENEDEIPQITQIVVPLIQVNNQTYFNLKLKYIINQ